MCALSQSGCQAHLHLRFLPTLPPVKSSESCQGDRGDRLPRSCAVSMMTPVGSAVDHRCEYVSLTGPRIQPYHYTSDKPSTSKYEIRALAQSPVATPPLEAKKVIRRCAGSSRRGRSYWRGLQCCSRRSCSGRGTSRSTHVSKGRVEVGKRIHGRRAGAGAGAARLGRRRQRHDGGLRHRNGRLLNHRHGRSSIRGRRRRQEGVGVDGGRRCRRLGERLNGGRGGLSPRWGRLRGGACQQIQQVGLAA